MMEETIAMLVKWVVRWEPCKTYNQHLHTYHVKHLAEHAFGGYVGEDELIEAIRRANAYFDQRFNGRHLPLDGWIKVDVNKHIAAFSWRMSGNLSTEFPAIGWYPKVEGCKGCQKAPGRSVRSEYCSPCRECLLEQYKAILQKTEVLVHKVYQPPAAGGGA